MVLKKIRFLRKKNKWSQTELANKLGLTRSSVKAWELGISTPSIATIVQLINVFQVSADFLLETNHNADIISLEYFDEAEREVIRKLLYFMLKKKGIDEPNVI